MKHIKGEITLKNNSFYYQVGALLYCPANKKDLADSIIQEKFSQPFSLALCLEDTIGDAFVAEAEQILLSSLWRIYEQTKKTSFYLPKLFIRVRNAAQILRLTAVLGAAKKIVTGFIAPKFSVSNADRYIQAMKEINCGDPRFYLMPIYESAEMIDLRKRMDFLYTLKDRLSEIEELVLNIRVGGNDLCHMFGFRRHADESIHKIRPIADIFSDIITVYGMDYVISGPVWEYYSGTNWDNGLRQELSDDMLCGFTGKTVIHPNQIAVVNESCKVSRSDLADATSILNWDANAHALVSGSLSGERMNEYKTHSNWAQKILFLSEYFGVRD